MGSSAGDRAPHGGMPFMGNQRPTQGARSGFVERFDRNGDGKVSRSEFDGLPDSFRCFSLPRRN